MKLLKSNKYKNSFRVVALDNGTRMGVIGQVKDLLDLGIIKYTDDGKDIWLYISSGHGLVLRAITREDLLNKLKFD